MHPVLKQFFIDLQRWVDSDYTFTPGHVFYRDLGLCTNLARYTRYHVAAGAIKDEDRFNIGGELRALFIARGLDPTYPFYSCSGDDAAAQYIHEQTHGSLWKNAERLAFVKQHAEDVCHQS